MSCEYNFILVQITTTNETEAQHLAKMLLKQRKAACINIIPQINTFYRWNNKIEGRTECLMLVKTQRTLLNNIVKLVKAHHSYRIPEIIATPLHGGSEEYLAWLLSETQA